MMQTVMSAEPCYLCRRRHGWTRVVRVVDAPVCDACAFALGRFICAAAGGALQALWRTPELPAVVPSGSARWHATAAQICLRAREPALALRHAGIALVASVAEVHAEDAHFALEHALAVVLSPDIYRAGVAGHLRRILFPA